MLNARLHLELYIFFYAPVTVSKRLYYPQRRRKI